MYDKISLNRWGSLSQSKFSVIFMLCLRTWRFFRIFFSCSVGFFNSHFVRVISKWIYFFMEMAICWGWRGLFGWYGRVEVFEFRTHVSAAAHSQILLLKIQIDSNTFSDITKRICFYLEVYFFSFLIRKKNFWQF